MKIYKEDYKHFRTCQKLVWFLNEQNYQLVQKLLQTKKIISFVELTNTKTSSKIQKPINLSDLMVDLDSHITAFSDETEDDFYAGETLADGLETGKYAQKYFESQYQCYNFETNNTLKQTAVLDDPKYDVFFEPRFEYNNCVTKCDVLKRNGRQWDLIEVKAVTWVKEEHMWDLLYQYDILTKCGIEIANVYIMYLNDNYFLQDKLDLKQLFIPYGSTWQKSKTSKKHFELYQTIRDEIFAHQLAKEYQVIAKILAIKSEDEIITFLSQSRCHDNQADLCPHIFTYFDVNETIFQLYRLRKKKKALWYYEHNLLSLTDKNLVTFVADNKLHWRQYDIAMNGEKPIDLSYFNALKQELSKYRYPIYMYDFETMKSAIPKFKNTKTYQQIPFQYSVHVLENPNFNFKTNQAISHYEFLADGETDPRGALTERLCHDLLEIHGQGTYVAYNQSFEKAILKSLLFNFPQYKNQLALIYEKTIDLQDFFKDFKIYKAAFGGSLSIKKTLPAFDSDFSYQDLKIQKGDMASEIFRRRVENNISLTLWNNEFRQSMLDYCGRDTFGMVVLFQHIKKLIEQCNLN